MDNAKLDKIRKLIEKAKGTTNAHEAAIFMQKAQSMMAEMGASIEDVDLSQIKEERIKSRFSVSKPKDYEINLMHAVAQSFGCELLWQKSHSDMRFLGRSNYAKFIFIGPKDRLQLATYAAEVLGGQLFKARQEYSDKISRGLWKAMADEFGQYIVNDPKAKSSVRAEVTKRSNAFALGWVYEIRGKVQKFALNDREQALIDTYVKNTAAEGEAKAKDSKIDPSSFYAGRDAAKDAHLHRPLDGSAEEMNLLGQTKQLSHGG